MKNNKKTVSGAGKTSANQPAGKKKKKNALFITGAVTVALALVVGIILGIIAIINSARAVMVYRGHTMDEKVATYLISVYKPRHLASLREAGISYADDSSEFWGMQNPDGSGTFGEGFVRASEMYLKEILVASYLYEASAGFTKDDKAAAKKSADQVAELRYNTEGFDALFEADARKMGYDYESYIEAAYMLYKARFACNALYGSDGSGASYLPGECNDFLKAEYTRVTLLFIRTETTFSTDADGNRLQEEGRYVLEFLLPEDAQERLENINSLTAQIDGYNSSGSPEEAAAIADKIKKYAEESYKADQSTDRTEYYFSRNSDYKNSFITAEGAFEAVVNEALGLNIDENGAGFGYCKIKLASKDSDVQSKTEDVWCFMYKSEPENGIYASSEHQLFFSDFYSDAAELYIYPMNLTQRCGDVKVKKKFREMPICDIPKNEKHVIREFAEA